MVSLLPSLPPSLPLSLPPSLPPSLPSSLHPSLFPRASSLITRSRALLQDPRACRARKPLPRAVRRWGDARHSTAPGEGRQAGRWRQPLPLPATDSEAMVSAQTALPGALEARLRPGLAGKAALAVTGAASEQVACLLDRGHVSGLVLTTAPPTECLNFEAALESDGVGKPNCKHFQTASTGTAPT